MSTNLLDPLKSLVTPELVSRGCNMLGESEGATAKALGAVFPTVLGGLLNKTQDPGVMRQIFALLTDGANEGSILKNMGSLLGESSASPIAALSEKFLSTIFGSKLGPVAGMLGHFAGIKSTSATSLMSMAASAVMGVLGDQIKKGGLNLPGLVSLLMGQRDHIVAAAPHALARTLGLESIKDLGGTFMTSTGEAGNKSPGWLWPLLVILATIALVWYLLRGCDTTPKPTAVVDTLAAKPRVVAQKVDTTVGKLGAFLKKSLPTNVQLNIPEFGIENTLLAFIQDPTRPVDKSTWFDFDRLIFETGSSTLKPASQEQLSNIAEILKAYPVVKVKVGGYTDNVGEPAANMKLSQERANNVMKELIAKGVSAARMTAEGYGDQHPVADNSTPEGRALNRRIALRVTAK